MTLMNWKQSTEGIWKRWPNRASSASPRPVRKSHLRDQRIIFSQGPSGNRANVVSCQGCLQPLVHNCRTKQPCDRRKAVAGYFFNSPPSRIAAEAKSSRLSQTPPAERSVTPIIARSTPSRGTRESSGRVTPHSHHSVSLSMTMHRSKRSQPASNDLKSGREKINRQN